MKHFISILAMVVLVSISGCSEEKKASDQVSQSEKKIAAPVEQSSSPEGERNAEESQALVLLSGLPTLDTKDSIAIVELDPESENFGDILYEYPLPEFDAPLHHLYYSPNGRLYATGLGGECSLAEISLVRNAKSEPNITDVECLDTQGQVVGEDIMWHTVNGKNYMFVTFMGGTGLSQTDAGSIGVFDPQSNDIVKIIEARKSQVKEGEPYIMYPHGISAYGDRMVVTSTSHPDMTSGVGNTVTIIDLNSFEPIENIITEDAKPTGFPSAPVEVLFVRPTIMEGVEPAILVNTMFGFETWKIPYNQDDKSFGKPERLYNGAEHGTGVPLEFYGNETELFISHAVPGVVKRYDLKQLPNLVSSGDDILADPGAHHMIFYKSASGRELIAIQNNLLNLGSAEDNDPTDVDFIAKINAHSVTVHDLKTGEKLATVNFKDKYQKGIDNLESLFGSGFVHHH